MSLLLVRWVPPVSGLRLILPIKMTTRLLSWVFRRPSHVGMVHLRHRKEDAKNTGLIMIQDKNSLRMPIADACACVYLLRALVGGNRETRRVGDEANNVAVFVVNHRWGRFGRLGGVTSRNGTSLSLRRILKLS
mmetsp:Transcript_9298/g.18329  ORF Transcript_9298/g.18329 Transcript_9298/m.18329 type:complete len:134 (+) Transcript_9298:3-404(+)